MCSVENRVGIALGVRRISLQGAMAGGKAARAPGLSKRSAYVPLPQCTAATERVCPIFRLALCSHSIAAC